MPQPTFSPRAVPAHWTPCPITINVSQLPPLPGPKSAASLSLIEGPWYDSPVVNNQKSIQDFALIGDKFLKQHVEAVVRIKFPEMDSGRRDLLSRLLQSNLVMSHLGFQLRLDELMPMTKEIPVQKADADRFEAFLGFCIVHFCSRKKSPELKKQLKDEFGIWLAQLFRSNVFPLLADCRNDEMAPIPHIRAIRSRYDHFEEQRRLAN